MIMEQKLVLDSWFITSTDIAPSRLTGDHCVPEFADVMVDGSWQTHDEFVKDVMENIDDQELSQDSDITSLICA